MMMKAARSKGRSTVLLRRRESQMLLAGSNCEQIHQQSIRLAAGDMLCLCTDHAAADDPLVQWQEKLPAATSPAHLTSLLTDLLKEAGQSGDITVLALQWQG